MLPDWQGKKARYSNRLPTEIVRRRFHESLANWDIPDMKLVLLQ